MIFGGIKIVIGNDFDENIGKIVEGCNVILLDEVYVEVFKE